VLIYNQYNVGTDEMAALGTDYTGLSVLIYDMDDNHLINTVISEHDRVSQRIQVRLMPYTMGLNDECKMLILSSPSPCEYHGKVKREGTGFSIALFQGHEVEHREATRYKVNTPAVIDAYICDDKHYPLHKSIKAVLINISTTGVRFRTPFYSLSDGDRFQIHIHISNKDKKLIAEVSNHVDVENKVSDYGCFFLLGKQGATT